MKELHSTLLSFLGKTRPGFAAEKRRALLYFRIFKRSNYWISEVNGRAGGNVSFHLFGDFGGARYHGNGGDIGLKSCFDF